MAPAPACFRQLLPRGVHPRARHRANVFLNISTILPPRAPAFSFPIKNALDNPSIFEDLGFTVGENGLLLDPCVTGNFVVDFQAEIMGTQVEHGRDMYSIDASSLAKSLPRLMMKLPSPGVPLGECHLCITYLWLVPTAPVAHDELMTKRAPRYRFISWKVSSSHCPGYLVPHLSSRVCVTVQLTFHQK